MHTQPELRERLKRRIIAEAVAGTAAGQWSARKAQLLRQRYEAAGGGYVGQKTEAQQSLSRWTRQEWGTRSGSPSSVTGERYLPKKALQELTSKEYDATTRAKRRDTAAGRQYSPQPRRVAEKVARLMS